MKCLKYIRSKFLFLHSDDWFNTASFIISLCRGTNTKTYLVPEYVSGGNIIFIETKYGFILIEPFLKANTTLPGYVEGYVKLEDDPNCTNMLCKR
jgi:hypothetical protein